MHNNFSEYTQKEAVSHSYGVSKFFDQLEFHQTKDLKSIKKLN